MATTTINIPDLGGATNVIIIEIPIKIGQVIEKDDVVAVLESDKATFEVPSPHAGVVQTIFVAENDNITEDTPLADLKIKDDLEEITKTATETINKSIPSKIDSSESQLENSTESKNIAVESEFDIKKSTETLIDNQKKSEEFTQETYQNFPEKKPNSISPQSSVHAGPAVRHLANQYNINLNLISGSGPKNRILKEDIHAFIKSNLTNKINTLKTDKVLPDFQQVGPISTQKLSRIQLVSANNLQTSWQTIPHVTQFIDADITELDAFRQSVSSDTQKITLLPFLIQILVNSLKKFPIVNSSLDSKNQRLVLKNYFHIGVAVNTSQGLVVPVIKNAEKKSILEIANEINILRKKSHDKKLLPTDMQDASCTISSLGKIGGNGFTPIINPPEVAILGVGNAQIKPVWESDRFIPRLLLPLSLSYDHRVINGIDGANFLQTYVNYLKDIRRLLL